MTNTKVTGVIQTSDGKEHQVYVATTDGTAAELTIRDLAGTLKSAKDCLRGSTITGFWLFVATPSDLDLIQFKDDNGAIVYEFGGCINAALGQNPHVYVQGMKFPVTEGCAIQVTTSD